MKSEAAPRLRLCLVNSSLSAAFEALGHEVLDLHPKPGVCDLHGLLRDKGFVPEILVQQESLGPRVLLRGLEMLDCTKVFWSVDTHQNTFWQEEYARLFDLTLSTQKHWTELLRGYGVERTGWLPWFGRRLPWIPWKERPRRLCFVGRVTKQRPSRQRFVAFLQKHFGLAPVQDVSFAQMLGAYQQSWLAPNESIFGEINFRLFEAASCGCLVFNQAGIPGLEDLLQPDREIVLFSHALDLAEKIAYCMNHPAQAERQAKAGWARIQEAHLPMHRARRIIEAARESVPAAAARGNSGKQAWVLTLYRLWQAERAPIAGNTVADLLLGLPESPKKRSALLGFWFGTGNRSALDAALSALLTSRAHAREEAVNRTGSLAALSLGDEFKAKAFWMRGKSSAFAGKPPSSPLEYYLAWARTLQRQNRLARPGLPFDHERHLPESVLDCLIMAHRIDPRNMDVCRRMDALLDKQPGFEPLRLSLLSHLTLHQRQNWLAGLKLGLVNLHGFRLEQGLEEIMLAAQQAESQGAGNRFQDALAVADPDKTIRQALAMGLPNKQPMAGALRNEPRTAAQRNTHHLS